MDVNQGWFNRRCYERTRGQLFCALHYKCVCVPHFTLYTDGSILNACRALNRRDVSGKNDRKDDDPLLEHEDEGNADLGKIVNLMQ